MDVRQDGKFFSATGSLGCKGHLHHRALSLNHCNQEGRVEFQRRTLPPWNWLAKLADVINKFLCVFNTIDLDQDTRTDQNDKNYQTEWMTAFVAVHGVLMFLLSFIFLIGLATLM